MKLGMESSPSLRSLGEPTPSLAGGRFSELFGAGEVVHCTQVFIDGAWQQTASSNRIDVISPHSERKIGDVPDGARDDIDLAVASARRALTGPWGKLDGAGRASLMQRFLEVFRSRAEEVARAQSLEMGCPLAHVRTRHVAGAIRLLEYYTDLARTTAFEEARSGATSQSLVRRRPAGVVAAIIPWNGPTPVAMVKVAPALAAGCTVVLKPAPEAPFSPYVIADIAREAGLPPGVLNVVPGGPEVGEYLVTHSGVNNVSFTGSARAGRRIASLCGERLTRVTLELGGKSAAIVLDDADVELTVEGLREATFFNAGQVCAATTRILIPRRRYEEFSGAIVTMAEGLRIGDPLDATTQLGPLVSERQRSRVEDYMRIGLEDGAIVATGGGRPQSMPTGWYLEPTVFVKADNSMTIAREEIFGPVITLIPYSTETEAIAIANDSEYGLGGAVWTSDVEHGLSIAGQVESGTIAVNGFGCDIVAPFGGMKASGLGREYGPEGLDAFIQMQSLRLPAGYQPERAT
jgi:aldehyde dehydrogenase (NAD+)